MSTNTSIEWTDATWSPTTGCDRISPGCDNCYALTMAKRLKAMGSAHYQNDGDPRTSGPGFKLTTHEDDSVLAPLRWKKPRRVFVNSMSDLFHDDVPEQFIAKVFGIMALAPQHTYQILTKRPQRMARMLNGALFAGFASDWAGQEIPVWPLPYVWLGTSIESDKYTFRADYLRKTPAAVRFISAEPLLGPLPSLNLTGIDWLIVGGESGPGARPMHPQWARDLRDQAHATDTAYFFKQWGAWAPGMLPDKSYGSHRVCYDGTFYKNTPTSYMSNEEFICRVGKKLAGRLLDGFEWNEFPK